MSTHPPLRMHRTKCWGATVMATPVVALASLIGTVAKGQGADTFSGSGVVIGAVRCVSHGGYLARAD